MTEPNESLREAVNRPLSLGQTMKAVAWSFFGVRGGAEHERDIAKLNPVHVIAAGVFGAALLVLMLVVLVRWVIASGVAT
jgi:hypothetical protein